MSNSDSDVRTVVPIHPESPPPREHGGYDLAEEETGLPRGTLFRLVFENAIPHQRLGPRTVVFSRKELAAWKRERHARFAKGER